MRTTPVTVTIVEDDKKTRDLLVESVSRDRGLRCAGAYPGADEALASMRFDKPDVVLLDLELPGMSYTNFIREARRVLPKLNILVLTIHEQHHWLYPAIEAGARGYLMKPSSPKEIRTAIRQIYSGGCPLTSSIAREILKSFERRGQAAAAFRTLTDRELQIVRLFARGYDTTEIATALDIAERTVGTHLQSIYDKVQVRTQAKLVAKFWQSESRRGLAG